MKTTLKLFSQLILGSYVFSALEAADICFPTSLLFSKLRLPHLKKFQPLPDVFYCTVYTLSF